MALKMALENEAAKEKVVESKPQYECSTARKVFEHDLWECEVVTSVGVVC